MKRVNLNSEGKPAAPVHLAAVETEVLRSFPQIIAHLTCTRYEDGTVRRVGTIGVRTQGPTWVAEARDYDAAARLRANAQSLDDALVLLDALLGSDGAPWEPDVYLQEGRGTRKK